ncbi:open rectifier K[+] channel 1 [Xylocopa sonorina]|uniref:open rectifier K[+] channel 1 n=1 Tax=Xylocopa sonorina TaxID=1818115 RepID=UPI00403AD662
MSKKQWLVLLMLFLTYLLLGASIFYHIESHLEIERIEKAKRERIEINALLHAHYVPSRNHDHDEILGKLTRYCGKSVYNYTENETDLLKWDFYNSFYFAYTVVSTIGYGNLAPTSMLGRILMIFYGLIGIPMNGILLTQLGEFFGHVFVKAHQKYKSYKHGHNDYYPRKLATFETGKVGLAAQIFAHLVPGFVMFIFFPAFLFSHYEGWTYDEAVYYAFVTLTTIGFGDYVAGQDNSKGSGFFFILYKTFLICWISFGLGYTVMIMTFIGRGMRSKKIARIEHKLAINLKHTQSKIWNEFNKEINYLRRAFNELQFSKVKRVYVDECNYEIPPSKFPRSNSFPDLRDLSYGSKEKDGECHRPRRRANSEMVPMEDQVTRVVSETDLQRIDKTATFATHAMVQPAELLARLVNILGYMPPATEDAGVIGSNQTTFVGQDVGCRDNKVIEDFQTTKEFPAKQSTTWSIGNERISRFARPRSRAASEVRLHETTAEDRNIERTWSGPTAARKIQELMKPRTSESFSKERATKETKLSKFRTFALARSVPKALISSGPWKSRFSTNSEKKNPEFEQEADSKDVEQSYRFVSGSTSIDDRRDSNWMFLNPRRHYYTHTGAGNNLNREGTSSLLEETSLADFLRALTVLHAGVGTNGGSRISVVDDDQTYRVQPRRKMGTASLTPPKLPSLFTLFSPVSSSQNNQTTITQESSGESRRGSSVFVPSTTIAKPRRFSLRPVATPVSPPTPPKNDSPLLSDSRRTAYENRSTFLFESPKEPLIYTEGIPGHSSPMKISLNARRFSLRPPAQNQNGISLGGNAAIVPTLKAVPRWKAGTLQRQIGQMNLRRRARAFSLSDVHDEELKERTEPFNLSSNVCKTVNRNAVQENASSNEQSRNDGITESIEHADRCTRSIRLEEESCSPFSRVTPATNCARHEQQNTQTLSDTVSTENVQRFTDPCTSRFRAYDDPCLETGPPSSKHSKIDRETFSNQPSIITDRTTEYTSFTGMDTESQKPLMEIKVENPDTKSTKRS